MTWVSDLSYDDQNMTAPPVIAGGQPFRKGWRVLNNGTCTWDSSYVLSFVQGNQPGARMGGQPTPIAGTVAPGATYDLYCRSGCAIAAGLSIRASGSCTTARAPASAKNCGSPSRCLLRRWRP